MTVIKRFFSEEKFDKVKRDLGFLVKAVSTSDGELDFQIRPENKLNLYYKGNSLAEITVQGSHYKIKVHKKFCLDEAILKDKKDRFASTEVNTENDYQCISIEPSLIHACLQQNVLKFLMSKIKAVNNGEEIAFEQSLMTDNLGRLELIIIDRQVAGGGIPGILDLLAIKETGPGQYSFVVLEVKLGNNPELAGDVADQLDRYVNAISNNFQAFKECYEKNYAQKKALGLFPDAWPAAIEIRGEVDGLILVGSYSRLGEKAIKKLEEKAPSLKDKVKLFPHLIEV